jgi:hypothetical protein
MKHKHHIIPRHMGGTDDPSNLIELTVEEHAEAHRVLYEEHGRWQDRVAWQGLSGSIGKDEIMQEMWEARKGDGNHFYGKQHTDKTKRKISEAKKGHTYNKGVPKSEAHKRSLSKVKKGTGTVYNFVHKDGHTFTGTAPQLSEHVGSNSAEAWKLVVGKYKTHKGYKVVDTL